MEPQLVAEIRTRKMASTKKICEGLAKLRFAPVLKGKPPPLLQLHAIVSSPVFVGENLDRFGSFIATSRKTALLVLFIRTSYFDHKSNIETKMKRMKGTQVSRQRYRAAP
jgi:hypothetical protein